MPDVIGVRFKTCGKIYDFEVDALDIKRGDAVVVESELGLSIGSVVVGRHSVANTTKELKRALRKAAEEDLKQRVENEVIEAEAKSYCAERIMARGLPMKLICTEATLDKKRIIFYFAAESRIDFRELVKDLAARFKTRIEMRQIGVRDEAKLLGGLGVCGRELCCKTFLTSFEPISIKMAKSQELVLNANKLSGVCGRLMCCLSYEYAENIEGGRLGSGVCVLEPEEEVAAGVIEEPSSGSEGDGFKEYSEKEASEQVLQTPFLPDEITRTSNQGNAPETTPEKTHDAIRPETKHATGDNVSPEGRSHRRRKRRRRRFRR